MKAILFGLLMIGSFARADGAVVVFGQPNCENFMAVIALPNPTGCNFDRSLTVQSIRVSGIQECINTGAISAQTFCNNMSTSSSK